MYPVLLRMGRFSVYSYGVIIAIAYIIGVYIAEREALRKGISKALIYDFAFYIAIGSIIGARLYYEIFFNMSSFIERPFSFFKIWEGGLSIHGAILGGILTGIIFCKIRRTSFWEMADTVSPSVILGQAIGRVGCFLNGCCFGRPTDLIFGIRFPEGSFPYFTYPGLRLHPVQVYEVILDFSEFLFLMSIRKKIYLKGRLFLLYLIIYSIIRLALSPFRGDSSYIWSTNFNITIFLSILIIVVSIIVWIIKDLKERKSPV